MASASGEDERRLPGGWQTEVHESGGTVYRSAGPHSATVIALLRHLEDAGFEAAPRVIGDGFAADGREALAFIEGQSPQPRPLNVLARDGAPVAFIDWDNAGPVDATWELAQVAWLNVQLHDGDVAELNGLPDAAHRAHQLRALVDAYGLERSRRDRFVDQIAEFAIHAARQQAVDAGVTPETKTATAVVGGERATLPTHAPRT